MSITTVNNGPGFLKKTLPHDQTHLLVLSQYTLHMYRPIQKKTTKNREKPWAFLSHITAVSIITTTITTTVTLTIVIDLRVNLFKLINSTRKVDNHPRLQEI